MGAVHQPDPIETNEWLDPSRNNPGGAATLIFWELSIATRSFYMVRLVMDGRLFM